MSTRTVSALLLAAAAAATGACGGADHALGPAGGDATRPPAGTRAAAPAFTRVCTTVARRPRWRLGPPCPSLLPVGGYERPRQYGVAPCAPLLDLEPRGLADRPGAVFHVLLGARCEPWDLATPAGTWPARTIVTAERRAGGDLRLTGTLRLLRRATVRGAPALILRNPPYPAGGIHGGHVTVLWNARGRGNVISGHPIGSRDAADAPPSPAAIEAAARTLLAVAASA